LLKEVNGSGKYVFLFLKLYKITSTKPKSFLVLLYHKAVIWIEAIFLKQVFYFWRGRSRFINGLPYRIPAQMEAAKD
jgi:hypothetical protein